MHLCWLPMLLLVIGWTTVTHFSGVSPNLIFTDYSLYKTVQLELLQIRVNILGLLWYLGNSIGFLFSFAQSSNWLPLCTSLFILVSLNILLHTYPHTALHTILHVVRVMPISSKYQNFNLNFTSLLSSLASVLPLMLPLFGIHFLKTFAHHTLLPLLERSSKPISTQRHILLSSFSFMASPWCRPISVPGFLNLDIAIVLLRLRVHYSFEIKHYKRKVKLELELESPCTTGLKVLYDPPNCTSRVHLSNY